MTFFTGKRADGAERAAGHRMLRRFGRDRRGATVVEYGLIVAVLSLAMLGGFGIAGDALRDMFLYQTAIIDDATKVLD